MAWPNSRHKTAEKDGSWTPADMNGVQDAYLRDDGIEADDLEEAVTEALGLTTTSDGHGGAAVRRGKCIIDTEETRNSMSYGTLTTPDKVSGIVLPEGGLLAVAYVALWNQSVSSAASAAIFLNSTQLKVRTPGSGPTPLSAPMGIKNSGIWQSLTTDPVFSLASNGLPSSSFGDDVGTGMILSTPQDGGIACIYADAGTYDVSIQFKASSGNVVAKSRKLWVWTVGF